MISIIITAFKEEKTVGKAIESFLNNQIAKDHEILVICPDDGTKKVVKEYEKKYKFVKHVQDQGHGKPAALTRPVSISPRSTMLGYWSHLLTDAGAHLTRLERVQQGQFIVASGYLFAMKRLFDAIPDDALADDGVMSYIIWQKGYKIGYAEKAFVYVKYPTTFRDWVLQKKRSTGGGKQIKEYFGDNIPRMRSFIREVVDGTGKALSYPNSPKEFFYTAMLFLARLYLWTKILIDLHLKKKDFKEIWKRVETTK